MGTRPGKKVTRDIRLENIATTKCNKLDIPAETKEHGVTIGKLTDLGSVNNWPCRSAGDSEYCLESGFFLFSVVCEEGATVYVV